MMEWIHGGGVAVVVVSTIPVVVDNVDVDEVVWVGVVWGEFPVVNLEVLGTLGKPETKTIDI